MFLKRISLRKNGKRHTSWALVKSVRTGRGPRHQVVSYLGEWEPREKAGWAHGPRIAKRSQHVQLHLFGDSGPADPVPEKVEVLVRSARVERTRDFGDVYLGLLLWQTLELERLLDGKPDRGPVERPIGRRLGRNSRPAGLLDITVRDLERDGVTGHLEVPWKKKEAWRDGSQLREGGYVRRTHLTGWKAEDLSQLPALAMT